MTGSFLRPALLLLVAAMLASACSTEGDQQALHRAAFRPVGATGPADTTAAAPVQVEPPIPPPTTA
ncbi:MAG TPA: hypothetical protein VM386_04485, partial [Acidimicrobiales bacterium]|nr:hypothetical protein [Acidimicrobiales bacterium]